MPWYPRGTALLATVRHRPVAGFQHLRRQHRLGQVVEGGAGDTVGREHLAGRQYGQVVVPAREGHRCGELPRWRGLRQVDDFRSVGGHSAAGVEDLARLVHHGRAVAAGPDLAGADRGPSAGAGDVEVARGFLFAGVEQPSVRRQERARVVGKRAAGAGQHPELAPGPDLGQEHVQPGLVGPRQDHRLVEGHGRDRGVPPAALHRRRAGPIRRGEPEEVDVGQAEVVGDVAARDQQPAVLQQRMTGAEERVRTGRRRENAGGRVPDLRHAVPAPGQHPSVGQQMQVHRHDRPSELGAPLARVQARRCCCRARRRPRRRAGLPFVLR